MRLTVNGDVAEVHAGTTVADLVAARAEEHRRVAVAVNADVVPRSRWASTALTEGDTVEVLVAVTGG